MPTEIYFGNDYLKTLKDVVEKMRCKRILLVTGRRALKELGVIDRLLRLLSNYKIFIYGQVEPNPCIETSERGIEFSRRKKISAIIALGGGSVLDIGKTIAIMNKNEGRLENYLYKYRDIKNRGIDFVAIPTTIGTGSEVTSFAVITDRNKNKKITLSHPYMYPRIAIIDSSLTMTLSRYQVAAGGIDALSHALEAYWSKNSQPISDYFSLGAIRLIFDNLERACKTKAIKYRKNLALASLFAGLAFSNTKTNIVHSASYPLTVYFNVPHGHACGITLAPFLLYNYSGIRHKIQPLLQVIGAKNIRLAAEKIEELMKRIGLPTYLEQLDIQKTSIPLIVKEAYNTTKLKLNPVSVTKKTLRDVIERKCNPGDTRR
jgi:alcohol dehydrogenase class IV